MDFSERREEVQRRINEHEQLLASDLPETVTVHLGLDYYAAVSKPKAVEFIQRRLAALQRAHSTLCQLSGVTEDGLPVFDIVEELDESGNVINSKVTQTGLPNNINLGVSQDDSVNQNVNDLQKEDLNKIPNENENKNKADEEIVNNEDEVSKTVNNVENVNIDIDSDSQKEKEEKEDDEDDDLSTDDCGSRLASLANLTDAEFEMSPSLGDEPKKPSSDPDYMSVNVNRTLEDSSNGDFRDIDPQDILELEIADDDDDDDDDDDEIDYDFDDLEEGSDTEGRFSLFPQSTAKLIEDYLTKSGGLKPLSVGNEDEDDEDESSESENEVPSAKTVTENADSKEPKNVRFSDNVDVKEFEVNKAEHKQMPKISKFKQARALEAHKPPHIQASAPTKSSLKKTSYNPTDKADSKQASKEKIMKDTERFLNESYLPDKDFLDLHDVEGNEKEKENDNENGKGTQNGGQKKNVNPIVAGANAAVEGSAKNSNTGKSSQRNYANAAAAARAASAAKTAKSQTSNSATPLARRTSHKRANSKPVNSNAIVADKLVEREVDDVPLTDDLDDMAQIKAEYQRLKQKLIYSNGNYIKKESPIETVQTKKVSRFKAARP